MPSFIIALLLLSTSAFTRDQNCYQLELQKDKNECMAFERDKAIGKLMRKITVECAQKAGMEDSETSSIYPMLLDECMTDEILELAKGYEG